MSDRSAGFLDRMLGKDKPWGDVDEARRLLQQGKIEDGRELLRRLVKHEPANLDALVLGAFELLRPPEERPVSRERKEAIDRQFPKLCESDVLFVLATWTHPSDLTIDCFSRMSTSRPRCRQGAAAYLLAQLCMSDIATKGVLMGGKGRIESATVTGVLKGSAQMMLRQTEAALDTYRGSAGRAEDLPALYEKHMNLTISPRDRAVLVETYGHLCAIGEGLALRDLGRSQDARAAFGRVAAQYPNFAPELQTLSSEA